MSIQFETDDACTVFLPEMPTVQMDPRKPGRRWTAIGISGAPISIPSWTRWRALPARG